MPVGGALRHRGMSAPPGPVVPSKTGDYRPPTLINSASTPLGARVSSAAADLVRLLEGLGTL